MQLWPWQLFGFGVLVAAGGLVGGGLVGGALVGGWFVAGGAEVAVGGAALDAGVGVEAATVAGGFVDVALRDVLFWVPWPFTVERAGLVGKPTCVGVTSSPPAPSGLASIGRAPGEPACMAVSVWATACCRSSSFSPEAATCVESCSIVLAISVN